MVSVFAGYFTRGGLGSQPNGQEMVVGSDSNDDNSGRSSTINVGACIAIGAGVGAAIGAAIGNIAVGVGVGVAIGAAIGTAKGSDGKNED